jgi:hypothetical protein
MLVAQFGLGMVLNLYVPVPASDQHAAILREISSAPLALTLHAVLGLALICSSIMLLIRAISVRDPAVTILAGGGLGAIVAAFAAGEIFVRTGSPVASLTMAILTGAALLCYIGSLAHIGAANRQMADAPLHPRAPARQDGASFPRSWRAAPGRSRPPWEPVNAPPSESVTVRFRRQ